MRGSGRYVYWLLVGYLCSELVLRQEIREGPVWTCLAEPADEYPAPAPAPGPRELRGIPGIGRRRALVIARALAERGPAWRAFVEEGGIAELRGLGPATAERLREALGRRQGPFEYRSGRAESGP